MFKKTSFDSGESTTLRRVPIKTTGTTTLTISSTGTANLTLSTQPGLPHYPGTVWPKNASVNTSKVGQVIGNLAVVELENGSFTVYNVGTTNCGFVLDVVMFCK